MTASTLTKLRFNWTFILFIAFVHISAMFALLPNNFSWAAVGLAVFLHWVTGGLGITLGFHRLVTHRSFQTPKWLEYFLVFCGALACEGGVIDWVGCTDYIIYTRIKSLTRTTRIKAFGGATWVGCSTTHQLQRKFLATPKTWRPTRCTSFSKIILSCSRLS